MNHIDNNDLEKINTAIERELLSGNRSSEEKEIYVSKTKIIFDMLIIVFLVLFIIFNVGIVIWKVF